jgi:outer membrane protein TolC
MNRSSLAGLFLLACQGIALAQEKEALSLDKAVALALEANPDAAAAMRGIDAARGKFWRALSPPPAQLSVTYEYVPLSHGLSAFGERTIGISQSFDFPTTIALKGLAASAAVDAAEADYGTAARAVTLRVKDAYYGVLAREQKLKLAEENFLIAQDFSRKAEIRLGVGEGTSLERLTARVQMTQAQDLLETAKNDLRVSRAELAHALGRRGNPGETEFLLTDTLSYRPVTLHLDTLVETAGRVNPQIAGAQARAASAAFGRSIAWSSILPSVSISYARQTESGLSNLYGVSLGISLPVWFLLDQRGQVEEASAEHARARWELRASQNGVNLDVNNAYLEVVNDDRQVRLYVAELLPQAAEVFRIAGSSYEAGEITYLEFLQARQTLVMTKSGGIDALLHYHRALSRLEQAVGQALPH